MEMLDSERVGALSKLIPRSPRTYQLEPTSNAVGPWVAGYVSGGAVPNKSAAEAGAAATVSPAQARDKKTFIGHPRIATPTQETATFQELWRLILNYYLNITKFYPYNTRFDNYRSINRVRSMNNGRRLAKS